MNNLEKIQQQRAIIKPYLKFFNKNLFLKEFLKEFLKGLDSIEFLIKNNPSTEIDSVLEDFLKNQYSKFRSLI